MQEFVELKDLNSIAISLAGNVMLLDMFAERLHNSGKLSDLDYARFQGLINSIRDNKNALDEQLENVVKL